MFLRLAPHSTLTGFKASQNYKTNTDTKVQCAGDIHVLLLD